MSIYTSCGDSPLSSGVHVLVILSTLPCLVGSCQKASDAVSSRQEAPSQMWASCAVYRPPALSRVYMQLGCPARLDDSLLCLGVQRGICCLAAAFPGLSCVIPHAALSQVVWVHILLPPLPSALPEPDLSQQ